MSFAAGHLQSSTVAVPGGPLSTCGLSSLLERIRSLVSLCFPPFQHHCYGLWSHAAIHHPLRLHHACLGLDIHDENVFL